MTIFTKHNHPGAICLLIVSLTIAIYPINSSAETKSHNSYIISDLQPEFGNIYTTDFLRSRSSKEFGWGENYDHFHVHHWPDPVNVRNGNLFLYYQDLFIPSMGIPMRIERVYNSRSVYRTPFGYGWNFNYSTILTLENDDELKIYESDGSITIYNRIQRTKKLDTYVSTRDQTKIIRENKSANYIRHLKNCGKEYFDKFGRLVKITDKNENSTLLYYDKTGNLTSITDPANRVINLTYSNNGLIISIKDPAERELRYSYDEQQNLIAAVDMNGHITRYFYDNLHNLIQVTYPDGSDASFEYDIEKDLILSEKGPGRKISSYAYYSNPENLITIVSDSLGRETKYIYNQLPHGLKFTKVDPLNKSTVKEYDNNGNLLKEIDKNGNEAFFTYDGINRLIRITDPSGNATKITYCNDCSGEVLKTIMDPLGNRYVKNYDENCNLLSITDPLGFTTRMTYDSRGNLISVTDPAGHRTTMDYDNAGNLITIIDPSENVKQMKYDKVGRMIRFVDEKGKSTNIKYDKKDRIVEIANPLGHQTAFTYDKVGRIKSLSNPDSNRTDYVYDESGYLSKIIDSNGNSQDFQYDSEGNQIEVSSLNGNVTKLYYDSRNRLIKTVDPYGKTLGYAYDAMSNLITHTDPNGKAVQLVFDGNNRINQIIDSQGNTIKLGHDPCGDLISIINEKGSEYRFLYDGLNRLIKKTDPNGHSVKYHYDSIGNINKVIDENYHQQQFEFNANGRVVEYVDQLGSINQYSYDSEGNLIETKNRRGVSTTYTYDSMNRLSKIMAADKLRATYSYNSNGNVVAAKNANVSYIFGYDKVGNLKSKRAMSDSHEFSLENDYDAEGNRISLYSKGIKHRTYEYDKNGKIKKIKNQFGEEFVILYNDLGLRKNILYPNGIVAQFEYCEFQKLCELNIHQLGGKVLKNFHYSYNKTGQLEECTEDGVGTTRYKYDKLGRLITIVKENGKTRSYEYDPAGNRISMNDSDGKTIKYQYNMGNQLVQAGRLSFAYDADGNMVSKKDGARQNSFHYDVNNFLTEVKTAEEATIRYKYGPFGERLLKEINGDETFYVHDNEDILWVLNSGGDIVSEYTHGPGFDAPLSVRVDNKSYYLHADRIGNIVLVTNTDGSEACRYSYSVFGEFEEKGHQVGNIHFFNGKLYDAESSIYYFINRYYDPIVGRFVQEDPIKVSLDQSNLYVYAGNNPLNLIDPLGLEFRGLMGLWEDLMASDYVTTLQGNKARENNVGAGSGGINSYFKDFNLLERIKRKDPAQLAKDCGSGGTPSNIDGTFGVKVGVGPRIETKARFDHSSAQFKLKTKLAISSSAEVKACVEVKEKGATGIDTLGGTNVGPVNYAFGVDSKGNWKGQLKIKADPVTIKTNFSEGGKLEGGKVEVGTGVSLPFVRFKKDLAEIETTLDIPGYTKIINTIQNAPIGGKECP